MKSDIKSTFKDTIIYGIGSLSTKVVGLILIPVYTEFFSTEDFGAIGILDVTLMAIVSIFGLQLYYGFFRYYWDKNVENNRKSLFFTILISTVFLAVFMCTLFYFTAKNVSFVLLGSGSYSHIFVYMCISAGLQIVSVIPLKLMQLQQRSAAYTIANILMLVTNLVFTLYFIIVLKKGIESIYQAQIIGYAVFFCITLKMILKNITPVFDLSLLKKILHFSYPMVLASLSTVLISISDKYILRFFDGLSDVGLYSFAYKLAHTIPLIVMQPLMLAVTPKMLQKMNDEDNRAFYSKILTLVSLIVMFCIIVISVYSKQGVMLLAQSSDYYVSYLLIPIISFGFFFTAMRDVLIIGLQISLKTKIQGAIVVFTSIFNVVANIVLIGLWNSYGAAFCALLTQLLYFVLVAHYTAKHYPIPLEKRKLTLIVLFGIVFIAISYIVDFSELHIVVALVVKTMILLGYVLALYMSGIFEKSELEELKSLISFRKKG